MTREEFINEMKAQVASMRKAQDAMKPNLKNDEVYHQYKKLGYEISALENAIREFECK